jgi:hypothetical protein
MAEIMEDLFFVLVCVKLYWYNSVVIIYKSLKTVMKYTTSSSFNIRCISVAWFYVLKLLPVVFPKDDTALNFVFLVTAHQNFFANLFFLK